MIDVLSVKYLGAMEPQALLEPAYICEMSLFHLMSQKLIHLKSKLLLSVQMQQVSVSRALRSANLHFPPSSFLAHLFPKLTNTLQSGIRRIASAL